MSEPTCPYVSRGGLKLAAALEAFDLDVAGWTCADLGASTGGFVDCLVQHDAERVYAVDTAYGELAWKLRQNDRVTVLERANALHVDPRSIVDSFVDCDLATIDLGWTRQQRAIPAALRWLKPTAEAKIISLIKPHYETPSARGEKRQSVLTDPQSEQVLNDVLSVMPTLGVRVMGHIRSPIRGGRSGRGNIEYLALLEPGE